MTNYMWILDFINRLFGRLPSDTPKETGLLLDDPEYVEAEPHYEDIFGATAKFSKRIQGMPSKDWSGKCPPFRNQGSTNLCTAFAGTNIGSTFERLESNDLVLFSPIELFFRAGGNTRGNSLLNTAKAMRDAMVLEKDMPTPVLSSWDFFGLKKHAVADTEEFARGKKYRMKSYVFVTPDAWTLHRALNDSPLLIAVGIGKGYWQDPAPATWSYGCYHALNLVAIDSDGNYVVQDSLAPRAGFNGFHRLAWNYPIQAAMAFVDLQDNWNETQAASRKGKYDFCLNYYGKPRNLAMEQLTASDLKDACVKHPTLNAYFGAEWTVAICAICYGGFSLTDLLNHYTSIRRGQGPIFDFNIVRIH